MNFNEGHHLFNEKYRPKTIDECILPQATKDLANGIVKSGKCPTLLFTGTQGIGKTCLANCIANELGADFMVINASMETGVDNIRTKVSQFASTVSFTDSQKITLLDEVDGISPASQAALKGFIEEFAGNHSLILTCNNKHKLIEPLHSRCQVIDFRIPNPEKAKMAAQFFKRVIQILDNESVVYDKKVVAEVVNHFFPDFRRCLNELQRYSICGEINSGILASFSSESFDELITILKEKRFSAMRKWVAQNGGDNSQLVFRTFYDTAMEKMDPKSVPGLIMLINEHQYKAAFVDDRDINLAAFLTEIIMSPSMVWK